MLRSLSTIGLLRLRLREARRTCTIAEGSPFHRRYGLYADPVSPYLASLPDGLERRLVALRLGADLIAWCLEPNDAAVSKYVRCEERDRVWCRAGLEHRILTARIIRSRFRTTYIVEPGEIERARDALAADVRELKRR